jgi:integrase/recombinase XerD
MMIATLPVTLISPLRQRLIEDMNMRRFSRATQRNYIRDIGRFAAFLRCPPDTATADDVRRFQVEQRDAGLPAPTMNSIVAALRFFFTHYPRPPRPCPQAVPRDLSAQAAGGAEP